MRAPLWKLCFKLLYRGNGKAGLEPLWESSIHAPATVLADA